MKKKVTWVKWNSCLASKAMGGLGIGSIYALNVFLFLSGFGDLDVIRMIYWLSD